MNEQRRGVMFGAAAYVMWGVFPLYFPLLEPAGAWEILGHRILWSLVVAGALVLVLGRRTQVMGVLRDRRKLVLLAGAAAVISINWVTYIWGVNNGRIVETSLGYFTNPLVTMLMGVLILRERLRRLQWVALGIAFVAVIVLTVDYGRLPWVALILAFSFGTYGLLKKSAGVGPFESLAVETAVTAPFALTLIVALQATGNGTLVGHGPVHVILLMSLGVATVVPLACFGAAAIRVPMVTIGLLQYLAPILQFAVGVFIAHEAMPPGRWVGFAIVWVALIIFSAEAVHHRRVVLRAALAPVSTRAEA
ncbi:chloramphenicol-sensitive protein RarD [Nocardioides albertanoniae]|uniref:Chloramphenicol-sensitive protein RarD n=1 Tax=Nocardioides albertanoniae TaxID=1175486 RepID=A0A543ADD1_9ACTN|nr:EamA family transporter RarD [Nocardioides albertanoniae]TQL70594.1 chloramphenicol-sensitive protein RarD [Nocardioides albertanoniae]